MMRKGVKATLDRLGDTLVSAFQIVALFVIGATIVWHFERPLSARSGSRLRTRESGS
jgi:hypothetical protein